jgi:DNA-directed RNA polymerase I, II, and III subunit RPABC2
MSSTIEEKQKKELAALSDDEDEDNEDYDFDDEDFEDEDDNMDEDDIAQRIFKNAITANGKNDDGEEGVSDDELEEEEEAEVDYGEEDYFKKTDATMRSQFVATHHPEIQMPSYDEIRVLCEVKRNEKGLVDDPRHRTEPFVRKYERARIIGERAVQLANGAEPYISMEDETSRFLSEIAISTREFEEKLLPFIIFRPLPHGGGEFWRLSDLETL